MQSFTVLPLYFHVGLSPAEPWEDASLLHPPSLILRDSDDVELLRTSLGFGDEGLEERDGVTGLVIFRGLDAFSFLLFSFSLSLLLSSSSLSLLFLSSSSLSLLFLSSSFSFLLRSREGLWGTVTVVLLGDTVVLVLCEPVAVFCTEVSLNCCVCCHLSCVHTSGNRYGGGDFLPGSNGDDDDGRETELLLLCADVFLAGVGVEDFGVGVERRCEVPIVMEVLLLLGRGEVKRSLVVTEFSELCRGSCGLLPLAMLLLAATVVPVVLRHFSTVL